MSDINKNIARKIHDSPLLFRIDDFHKYYELCSCQYMRNLKCLAREQPFSSYAVECSSWSSKLNHSECDQPLDGWHQHVINNTVLIKQCLLHCCLSGIPLECYLHFPEILNIVLWWHFVYPLRLGANDPPHIWLLFEFEGQLMKGMTNFLWIKEIFTTVFVGRINDIHFRCCGNCQVFLQVIRTFRCSFQPTCCPRHQSVGCRFVRLDL